MVQTQHGPSSVQCQGPFLQLLTWKILLFAYIVLVHKQRMSSRSIGHSYHRSTSNCFSPWIFLCRIFQLRKKTSQINPPVFSTWQCYKKCGGGMTPCNMMHYPMLEIFGSASPVVITAFYIPWEAPEHLYITCIFVLKLFFQFLNSWWVSTNEAIRFEEEIALAVICVSLDDIIQK